jgi:concanavalin A-like lectin/glucanase superfamily protein
VSTNNSYLHFDGLQSYIEIPDSPNFSLTTTRALAVSAWIRPSTLTFPSTEGKGADLSKAYVHWMGKGEAGQQEWLFRMYSLDNTDDRANRISFYVFNLDGGLGVGSYYQDPNNPIQVGVWIHVLGAADSEKTYLYINGTLVGSDVYSGQIQPQPGTAPFRIGTRDFNSFFEGEIREVRCWNRLLTAAEVTNLYTSDLVPQDGLVAEFLLTQDIAVDTTADHDGFISGATWITADG